MSSSAGGQDEPEAQSELPRSSIDQGSAASVTMGPPSFDGGEADQRLKTGFGAVTLSQANPLQLVATNTIPGMPASNSSNNNNNLSQCRSCKPFMSVEVAES
jgi:hypothetical protein